MNKKLKIGAALSGAIPVDEGTQHGRRIGHLASPDLPIVYDCFAHHDCIHNQLVSFHNRVAGETVRPTRRGLERMRSVLKRMADSLPDLIPWEIDQVVDHYKGAKRKRYADAAEEYRISGLLLKHKRVKMFIKCEKTRFNLNKVNPDPRAIQHRDPVFALVLAQFIKPIEEHFYLLKGNRQNRFPPTRIFGKGMDSYAKARLLEEKWSRFTKPVAISIDVSRLDKSADIDSIRELHRCFIRALPDPEFASLLSKTEVNEVCSSRGLKYKITGNIMSGDVHTSLQGCALMASSTIANMEQLAVKYDLLDDGDDCIVFVEEEDYTRVATELPPLFLEMGLVIVVENVARTIEKVRWCQSSPVRIDGVLKFVRAPEKVLSGALVGARWLQMHSEKSKRAYANTIGLGEGILNQGVPILQEFALAIIRNAATTRQVRLSHNDSLNYKVRHETGKSWLNEIPTFTARPIGDETRLSFSEAFGISVTEQLDYEEYLRRWKFEFNNFHEQPEAVDVANWQWQCNVDERT